MKGEPKEEPKAKATKGAVAEAHEAFGKMLPILAPISDEARALVLAFVFAAYGKESAK